MLDQELPSGSATAHIRQISAAHCERICAVMGGRFSGVCVGVGAQIGEFAGLRYPLVLVGGE